MKLRSFVSRMAVCLLLCGGFLLPAAAADKKPLSGTMVDSGTFGIFVNGQRVGSETFQIEQGAAFSVTRSSLKVESGSSRAEQTAELQLTSSGDLKKYEWKEIAPGKAQATVEPKDEFLVERTSATAQDKAMEQPYFLPVSTLILDDYFFSQREILLWRYLAGCQPQAGKGCTVARSQFGVLVPRQRTPMMVTISYVGKEKVAVRGQERELEHFNLQCDGTDWALYVDASDRFKLMKVTIAAANTEVVRE